MLIAILTHVTHLGTEAELDAFIQQNPAVLMKFYRPACGHCKHLSPRFYDLSEQVPNARLAEFDCSGKLAVCQRYSVSGVPSIQLFKGGSFAGAYEELWRDPKPMHKWLKE